MKTVIFAGGRGTRIAEETSVRPKPMVDIGGFPILWHIMKIYSSYGFNDFVICLGYLGNVIKDYFHNYLLYSSDVTFDLNNNTTYYHCSRNEPWRITLVDTGLDTNTAGRLLRVRPYIEDSSFFLTYGDGVSDVNLCRLLDTHRSAGRLATMTIVRPTARYGSVVVDGNCVTSFVEKPQAQEGFINGGFFVLEPAVLDFIHEDSEGWEYQPLERIVAIRQLTAFTHTGYWQAMDTLRDKIHLDSLWASGSAPWKVW